MRSPIPGLLACSARMRLLLFGGGATAILVGGCLVPWHAAYAGSATCPSPFKLWSATTAGGPASAPVTDTAFSPVPGRSRSYVTQGDQLLTFYNVDYPEFCFPGTGDLCAPTGGNCTRVKGCKLAAWTAPVPTPLASPVVVP